MNKEVFCAVAINLTCCFIIRKHNIAQLIPSKKARKVSSRTLEQSLLEWKASKYYITRLLMHACRGGTLLLYVAFAESLEVIVACEFLLGVVLT